MASNIIDLISSSPPRDVVPPRPTAAKPDTAASNLAQVEIHSDDFCSSGDDVFESGRLVNEPIAKRPRLSAEGDAGQRERPSAFSLTQPFQATGQKSKTLLDDIEFISSIDSDPFSSPKPRTNSLKRSRTESALPSSRLVPSSDPFASSPPPKLTARSANTRIAQDLSSDPFASSPVKILASTCTSNTTLAREPARPKRTAAAWDPISSSAPCSSAPPKTAAAPSNHTSRSPSVISIGDTSASSDDDLPALGNFDLSQGRSSYHNRSTSSVPKAKSANKSKRKVSDPTQRKSRQTIDPSQRAAAKAAEKEHKRREREREKEERQRQRDVAAAIVEVNKAKGNRKVSTKEMIVDIPLSLPPTIKVQLETLLDGLEVQHGDYDSAVHNVVKWRRRINSRFDDESGQWVPMPLRIDKEEHALLFMTAEDIVQLALDDGLDKHMTSVRSQYPTEKLVYILQGVTTWMRKNRNTRNRQFAAGVRSQGESQAATGRRQAEQAEYVDEDAIEDAILRLQVEHDVLIHHTAIPLETAQWISIFTQNISTIPYKKQKDEDTAGARFCMESGQVKTGDSTQDTYVRMLQEIFRVTAPIAYGVASEFGTVTKLVEGLAARGPTALEQVRKSANKDGAFSDRAIGPAVSKRLYKIFTGTDETSTDV
ncbi:alpha-1,2-mannosyltransferase (Alg2), putative [Cordyceps militaris CM01]|uniref:Alpha-1,2-mannosyltransferase (Alg2), putative n=1 Tax=Cordyceps militaris (strain CM01) TaxID=983644 RepID=G3JCM7_CORMM|nr:alpha-1,2-mannosyltransferase (Alg2), putative [Cordyceps militaris CM01]EGX93839.1 alpha-1,2-mannosyltransferase (Alg2), putative [Cordyceps militaris CM01]